MLQVFVIKFNYDHLSTDGKMKQLPPRGDKQIIILQSDEMPLEDKQSERKHHSPLLIVAVGY